MTLAARIRRLSVAFHERTILHDITLDIPAEGITVLLGRSGSGKTTFLRALNRLNECLPGCRTSGEAELRLGGGLRPIYAGRTGEAALSDLRRRVGMVFQTPNILPASIRQNMLLPLQLATAFPASEWRERMERSLTEVGLWHDVSSRLREPASILSGGATTTPLPCPYAGARTGNPAPRRTHGIPRSRDNPHHRKPAPQAGGALSHPSRLTWVAASPKNGLADCPVWERTSARYAFARRTPQRSRNEPFFRRRGRWKSLREKRTAPPFPHRMEICLALSAPLLQPVASTIQKNAHPNGCAFLHCLLASLYHWSIHSRKSACPVSLALSPARLVSSRRRRGSIAARANSQACPTNHLSSLSASTSGWNCNAST